MSLKTFAPLTLLLLGLAVGCADHASVTSSAAPTGNNNPPAPIPGDTGVLQPGAGGGDGQSSPSTTPGSGVTAGPVGGSSSVGGSGSTGGGSTAPGNQGTGGGNPGGAAPVPEPGTILLVGTGLAGAALLRRRRVAGDVQAED